MRPTRLRALLVLAVVGAGLGWLLVRAAYNDLPPLPVYAPVTLLLLAVAELGMAKVVRDRVLGRARRGARPLHPLQIARAAALAKASSPAGALLLGAYAGMLLVLLPKEAEQAAADALVSGASALAALGLVVAALLLERACRTPDGDPGSGSGRPDRAGPGLGSRA